MTAFLKFFAPKPWKDIKQELKWVAWGLVVIGIIAGFGFGVYALFNFLALLLSEPAGMGGGLFVLFIGVSLILNRWRMENMEEEIKKLKLCSAALRETDSQSYKDLMPSIKK